MTAAYPEETVDAVIALLAKLERIVTELRRKLNEEQDA